MVLQRDDRENTLDLAVLERDVLYHDNYVQLSALQHPTREDTTVGYVLRCRRRKRLAPIACGSWWASVFYRRKEKQYSGRRFRTVYDDGTVLLYRYGKRNSDYLLVGRSPPPEDRHSDVRFSTIPNTHPIERE